MFHAAIFASLWMTRSFFGTGSFEKRDHERPVSSPTTLSTPTW